MQCAIFRKYKFFQMAMNFTRQKYSALQLLSLVQSALQKSEQDPRCYKPKQLLCWESLLNGLDVIAVLPTGYGKSLLFQLLPDIIPPQVHGKDNIVVVLCPLTAIIKDQVKYLAGKGIKAGVLCTTHSSYVSPNLFEEVSDMSLEDSADAEVETQLISKDLKNGAFKIVFSHPEAILSKAGRDLLKSQIYQSRVVAWAVDEAHCIEAWYAYNLSKFKLKLKNDDGKGVQKIFCFEILYLFNNDGTNALFKFSIYIVSNFML